MLGRFIIAQRTPESPRSSPFDFPIFFVIACDPEPARFDIIQTERLRYAAVRSSQQAFNEGPGIYSRPVLTEHAHLVKIAERKRSRHSSDADIELRSVRAGSAFKRMNDDAEAEFGAQRSTL